MTNKAFVTRIVLMGSLSALSTIGCRMKSIESMDGGGSAQGASGLSSLDMNLPDRSRLQVPNIETLMNGFQIKITPKSATTTGCTTIDRVEDYTTKNLASVVLKQGCAYTIDLAIGQRDPASTGRLKETYLKTATPVDITEESIRGQASVKASVRVAITDAGKQIGLSGAAVQPSQQPQPSVNPSQPPQSSFPAAKDFNMTNSSGRSLKFSEEFKGKYAIVDFSRSTCGPCIEMGNMIAADSSLMKMLDGTKCTLVTLIPRGDSQAWASAVSGAAKHSFETAGPGWYSVAESALGIQVAYTPFFAIVDRSGNVVERGQVSDLISQYCQ